MGLRSRIRTRLKTLLGDDSADNPSTLRSLAKQLLKSVAEPIAVRMRDGVELSPAPPTIHTNRAGTAGNSPSRLVVTPPPPGEKRVPRPTVSDPEPLQKAAVAPVASAAPLPLFSRVWVQSSEGRRAGEVFAVHGVSGAAYEVLTYEVTGRPRLSRVDRQALQLRAQMA